MIYSKGSWYIQYFRITQPSETERRTTSATPIFVFCSHCPGSWLNFVI